MSLTALQWTRFLAECERLGLGLVRTSTAALAPEGARFPAGATHAVLPVQAGGLYWEQLRALRKLDPALDTHADPLDTMTQRLSARLAALLGDACAGVHFPFDDKPLDFVKWGTALGAGAPGRLSILMHPTYGPWIAFRMLFFVRDELSVIPPSGSVPVSPCESCAAPCMAACPAGAFTGEMGHERLDYAASFTFRREHAGTCTTACAARLACPVGVEYRYPADFIESAQRRAFETGLKYLGGGTPPIAQPAKKEKGQGTLF